MPQPDLAQVPQFYHRYISLVTEEDVVPALEQNADELHSQLRAIPHDKWDYRYAADKWTLKELVQHMIDTERIFSYRALCFARGEKQSLPGFDENEFAKHSNAQERNSTELIDEFFIVRTSTLCLFRSFSEEQINRVGTANNKQVSVNAIGFLTAGHVRHHLNIINERYLA